MRHFRAKSQHLDTLDTNMKFSCCIFSCYGWAKLAVSPDKNFEKAPSWTPKCATDAPPFVKDAPIFSENAPYFLLFYCIFINKFLPNYTFLAKKILPPKNFLYFLGQSLHIRKMLMIVFTRKKIEQKTPKRASFFDIFVRFIFYQKIKKN